MQVWQMVSVDNKSSLSNVCLLHCICGEFFQAENIYNDEEPETPAADLEGSTS